MNDLQIFIYSGNQLRTVKQPDGLWWVLRDVCDVLGMSNPAMVAQRLDDDEKSEVSLAYTSSNGTTQSRVVTIINEPGLYSVILRSDKPEAKAFKRWVTHDVLPSIRRTGAYSPSADHSEKVAYLQALRTRLREWQDLEKEFSQIAANDRKRYEKNRSNRDKCRIEISKFENLIDAAIQNLDNSTPNKAI